LTGLVGDPKRPQEVFECRQCDHQLTVYMKPDEHAQSHIRALLAEGPDQETITRLQQLVETWQTMADADRVALADTNAEDHPRLAAHFRAMAAARDSDAKDLSALLTSLASPQETT
jgi:septal ring factor EnvC (AmiA/AmiB activator)